MKYFLLWITILSSINIDVLMANNTPQVINSLSEIITEKETRNHYLLTMGHDTYGLPIQVPVIVINGREDGEAFGMIAAIHGNELNGIAVIHDVMDKVDPSLLKGRIVAIAGVNAESIKDDRRRFIDDEDLNRNFPGKEKGNRSQQYVYNIKEKILPYLNYLVDMHTASFGRVNTFYARADMKDDTLAHMAKFQGAEIILNSKGKPSASEGLAALKTMRAYANEIGVKTITVEYGNPQVFQKEIIHRAVLGIFRTIEWLNLYHPLKKTDFMDSALLCKKSYWIYMDKGGFLDVLVELKQIINKGQKIAVVKNGFGEIIDEYFASEKGVVIGKSTNPSNMSGGRILHLGILQ